MADSCDVLFVEAASASELAGFAGAFQIQVSSYEGVLGPTGDQDFWTLTFKIVPPPGSLAGPMSCSFGRPYLHSRAEWSLVAAGARGASVGRGDQYWLAVVAEADEPASARVGPASAGTGPENSARAGQTADGRKIEISIAAVPPDHCGDYARTWVSLPWAAVAPALARALARAEACGLQFRKDDD